MIRYIIRRLLVAVLLLAIISLVTFGIFFLLPKLAGQSTDDLAARYLGREVTPEGLAGVKAKLGLDDPFLVRYWEFVQGIFVGADYKFGTSVTHCPAPCMGFSYRTNEPVFDLLLDRAPVTFSIALGAAVLWLLSGVTIGVISALKRGSVFDRASMSAALAGVSLPMFFTGLVSIWLVCRQLKLLPTPRYHEFLDNPATWAQALILPWITLAFLYAAMYARLTRAGMLETMGEDYIRTARAKGLPERTVITRHGLRSALTPIITIFGLDIGLLLGGAVITETTFSFAGLGQLMLQGITRSDLPVALGVTMATGLFVIIANLVVDILYAVADPRVRLA
ncbi:ABC transporter permease [Actinomadura fulvescens]|uniref:ABC transporter permease n=1 Tax=Actinomadura fulvescens TaxID=46160 RepID=UPI0031E1364F